MKKLLIIFLLLFSFSIVKAENNDTNVRIEWIPNINFKYLYEGEMHYGHMGIIYANDNVAYCLDVDKIITTNLYSSSDDIDVNENIILYSYFGYKYLYNTDMYYYLAAQQLIWEELGVDVIFFNIENNDSNMNLSSYRNDILNYVNDYKKELGINDNFNFELGLNNYVIHSDYILANYEVINDSKNVIKIFDNNLFISTIEGGKNNFSLGTNYEYKFDNKIYTSLNSQKLISVGNISKIQYKYDYDVSYGSIGIELYNKLNNAKENVGASTLKGNIFNLYDENNNFIDTYESNEWGNITINNLNIGKYRLEHLYASEGYKKEKTIYNVSVDSNNINPILNIYLEPKNINFNIKVVHGNPKIGNRISDSNIKFEIINSNGEQIDEIITNEFGKTKVSLFYDTYKIVQKEYVSDKKADDYIIQKSDFNGDNYYNIYIPIYDASLKVFLYESGSTLPISNANFIIDGKNYKTNEDGYFITEVLKEGCYDIYEESINSYYKPPNIKFNISKDNEFYVNEGIITTDLILYNEKIVNELEEKEILQPVNEIVQSPELAPVVEEPKPVEVTPEVNPVVEESKPTGTVLESQEESFKDITILPNLYTCFFTKVINELYDI